MRHATRNSTTALLVFLLAFSGACDEETATDGGATDAGEDAGTPPMDGGNDAGTDSGNIPDAGRDAGPPRDAGPSATHLLITEVGLLPAGAEIVEIMNPGSSPADLADVYLSDNSAYHQITSGPWSPGGTPDTDWVVRFPVGATIPAGGVVVVALSPEYESVFSACPDFVIDPTETDLSCGGASVPAMRIPANGSVGASVGSLLSNSGEMVILFTWDGSASTVQDLDYVTFDPDADPNTHVDKTGLTGYSPDTGEIAQVPAPIPSADETLERCDASEPTETTSGGNGADGHDETSEDMNAGFRVTDTPSVGTRNGCL